MGSGIHWPVQSTSLLLLKEDSPLTMVMIFVSTSVIVVFSDKRDSRKAIDSRLKVSFLLNQSKNNIYSLYCLHTCSESLHTKCVVFLWFP